jgi:voltage-gated potassium channel Kch
METFSMIALVAVVTMTLTPFVATDRLAWRLLHVHPRWRRADTRGRMKGHVLMLGFGSTGMWVAKPFIESGRQLLVVDDDPVVIEQLGKMNIPCLRGDASDVKLLQRAGAKDADLIISALPRTADVLKILANRGHTPVIARTFEASDAAKIRKAGGLPVLNAEAAMTAFFEWFDQSLIPPGK